MKVRVIIPAAIAVMTLAGCGASRAAHSTTAPAKAGPVTTRTASAAPAVPFTVKILYAGPLTTAQQNQYGADSPAVVYSVTNTSTSPGVPDITVQFLNGSDVASSGFAGAQPELMPGQTETAAEGDSVPDGGSGESWTAVSVVSVTDETSGAGQGTYPLTGISRAAS